MNDYTLNITEDEAVVLFDFFTDSTNQINLSSSILLNTSP